MISGNPRRQGIGGLVQMKWLNSPVTHHEGSLDFIRPLIPRFERSGFSSVLPGGAQTCQNRRLDTIVRQPIGEDKLLVPVGVVSKDYTLVQHSEVLDVAAQAMEEAKIPMAGVRATLKITEFGERMALGLFLPSKYNFDPGDGHPMALRLECLNSVEGSTRFRALLGWFRLICSNGMVIGVTRFNMRRRHVGVFNLGDIGEVLSAGLEEAETEKRNFERWRKMKIPPDRLRRWTEDILWKRWGFKAATRAFNISRTGKDVEIVGRYKGATPTAIAVRETHPVPGVPVSSSTLFDLSQILAWLAQDRRDLQEQLEWREQITDILTSLT